MENNEQIVKLLEEIRDGIKSNQEKYSENLLKNEKLQKKVQMRAFLILLVAFLLLFLSAKLF